MKNKAIIPLLLILAMVIGTTIAFADTWTPSALVSEPDWTVMNGEFGGSFSGDGVYSVSSDYSSAAHAIPASSDGNFVVTIPFKLYGDGTTAYVGISTASSAQDTSGWTVIGNGPDNALGFSHGGLGNIDYFGDSVPSKGTTYTARIASTDGGKTATIGVDGYGSSRTVTLSSAPKYVVIYLNNNGTTGVSGSVPAVMGANYQYQKGSSSPTPTPSTSPTPTPTPTNTSDQVNFMYYLNDIRSYYANQPVVHMSNQSVIYNPDGTIKQVITGNQTVVTPSVAAATPTAAPNATVKANATVTPVPAKTNATAVPSLPAATKTQSPGFEVILAAIGMISALVLITRKKK